MARGTHTYNYRLKPGVLPEARFLCRPRHTQHKEYKTQEGVLPFYHPRTWHPLLPATSASPEGGGPGDGGCLRVGALLFLVGSSEDVAQRAHLVLLAGGNPAHTAGGIVQVMPGRGLQPTTFQRQLGG